MPTAWENDEDSGSSPIFHGATPEPSWVALPLVRRRDPTARRAREEVDEDDRELAHLEATLRGDRMAPSTAGGIAGFVAGMAALSVVQATDDGVVARAVAAAASARDVADGVAMGIAYATAASIGALVGAAFAVVTRYLRRWLPLLLWAVVFFVSLALLVLAAASAYGRGVQPSLSAPVLLAGAVYGVGVAFSLPIRRRR